jgi:hypothetical protein
MGQSTDKVILANWKIEDEREQVRRGLEEEQRLLTDRAK